MSEATVDKDGLEPALASRLRSIRESHGLRQEDIAASARFYGLRWNRSTVTAIEAGKHELTLTEWATLPYVLERALGKVFDPLPTAPVALTERLEVSPAALRHLLAGRLPRSSAPKPKLRFALGRETSDFSEAVRDLQAVRRIWPDAPGEVLARLEVDAAGEAEQKAARRFGVWAGVVALASHRLWGRTLSEERDRRVLERAPSDTSPRTLQAFRGHITRALVEELKRVLVPEPKGQRRKR